MTKGQMDALCPKCERRIGWSGTLKDRPRCECGHRPSDEELERDQAKVDAAVHEALEWRRLAEDLATAESDAQAYRQCILELLCHIGYNYALSAVESAKDNLQCRDTGRPVDATGEPCPECFANETFFIANNQVECVHCGTTFPAGAKGDGK